MSAENTATNTKRLEMRTSEDTYRIIKRAARLQRRTMADFMADAVRRAAQKVVEQNDIISLALEDQKRFAEALLSPPKPNAALKRAFERHSQVVND